MLKAEEPGVQGHLHLHCESEASLEYMKCVRMYVYVCVGGGSGG